MSWLPIESAPKDIERCLLWCADLGFDGTVGAKFGRINRGKPYAEGMIGEWKFTHWMPLPEPPHA